jgi:hypothetical protein
MVRANNTDRRFEMAGNIQFKRDYAAFGSKVRPFEKSDDVGSLLSWILGTWLFIYPVGALVNAKISGIYLGKGEKPAGDVDNLDLIFKMAQPGAGYFEIILRSKGNPPVYGGWAVGESLEVTDEIVNGHRVLIAKTGTEKLRYEYTLGDPSGLNLGPMYALAAAALTSTLSTAVARKLAQKSRH